VSRLKQRKPDKGRRIAAPTEESEPPDDECRPLFCFQYLQPGYCISDCNRDQKAALADKLREMSQLTWQQLRNAPRHGQGYEKIAQNAIKAPIPGCVTEDVNIIAFRFHGTAPVVGYRARRIFHVFWLDRSYSLYKHG